MLKRNYGEATRNGVRGFVQEVIIESRSWGFRLEDIQMPVRIWHGDQDSSTPIGMARYMAQALPNCRATYLPGEGHFIVFTHWREILSELVSSSL